MSRLTEYCPNNGKPFYRFTKESKIEIRYRYCVGIERAIERLAAYENTGLEPEEIRALQDEHGNRQYQGWVPVTERLPGKSDIYICAFEEQGEVYVERFWFITLSGWLMPVGWANEGKIDKITHWQPLPQPPKKGDDPE